MAISYWQGPGPKKQPLQGGDFATASNWSTGAVPGAGDAIVLGKGNYTVTCAVSTTLQALTIGKGATLLFGGGPPTRAELLADSTNSGTLQLDGAGLTIDTTLVNVGAIEGRGAFEGDGIDGGTIVNQGSISNGVGDRDGSLNIFSAIDNRATGTISADTGFVILVGTVTNSGLIAAHGGTLGFGSEDFHGALTNFSGSILSGGHWSVGAGSMLMLYGDRLNGLSGGADVVLDGVGSTFGVLSGATTVHVIDETLSRIDAGSALHVLGGRDFGQGQSLTLGGELEIGGGTVTLRTLEAATGSLLTGYGTVAGTAEIDGQLVASGGTLDFLGNVSLEGDISGKGALELSGASNKLLAGSDVAVATLTLDGGNTRVLGDTFAVGHLVVDGASLDLAGIARTLGGEVDLNDGSVLGSASLKLSGDHVTSTGESRFGLSVVNTGTITVESGDLTFERALSGKGEVHVDAAGTVTFGAAANVTKTQLIAFDGGGTVEIAAPATFAASFGGFGAGATIELTGFDADTATLKWKGDRDGSGGTLKVSDQGVATTLHFADGHYDKAGFETFQFGDGVLAITYNGADGGVSPSHGPVFGSDTPVFAGPHGFADLPIGLIALA